MSDELKPCPFCGLDGETIAWRDKSGKIELVEHPNTDCILSDLRTECIDLWNRRASEEVPSE
jgi:hypothetical protein